MRDPSPYARQTVKLRADAREFGGLDVEVEDWFSNVDADGRGWRQADLEGDPKAQGYQVRRAGLPDDDEVLIGWVDGIKQLIHVAEIEGSQPAVPLAAPDRRGPMLVSESEIDERCVACTRYLAEGDFVAQIILGPGATTEARAAAREGRPYRAAVIEIHWACATGQVDVTVPREVIPELMAAKGVPDSMLP